MAHLSFAHQASIPQTLTVESIRIEIFLHVKQKPKTSIPKLLPKTSLTNNRQKLPKSGLTRNG
jgi:hypothetical protein